MNNDNCTCGMKNCICGKSQFSSVNFLESLTDSFIELSSLLDYEEGKKLSAKEKEAILFEMKIMSKKLEQFVIIKEDNIDSSTDELPENIPCESFEDVVLFVKNKINENLGKDIALLPADDIEQRTIGLALLIGEDEGYVLQTSVSKPTNSLLLDVYLEDTEGFCESLLKKNKSIIKYNNENLKKQKALSYIKSSVVEMDAIYDHLKAKFSEERIKNCNLTFLSSMTDVISEIIQKLSSYKLDEVDMIYSVAPVSGDRKANEVNGSYKSSYDIDNNGELVVVRSKYDINEKRKGRVSRTDFRKLTKK